MAKDSRIGASFLVTDEGEVYPRVVFIDVDDFPIEGGVLFTAPAGSIVSVFGYGPPLALKRGHKA